MDKTLFHLADNGEMKTFSAQFAAVGGNPQFLSARLGMLIPHFPKATIGRW